VISVIHLRENARFDPQPGDRLTAIDEDAQPLNGRVVIRDGNRLWVQVEIPGVLSQSA
jgi:hypothetical protein